MAVPSPKVSVIMATLDRAGHLPTALDSVLSQDFDDYEIIVVDDGSEDDTPAVLGRYEASHGVRVLRNRQRRGLPAALNRAIEVASGQYLARIDDDDAWTDAHKLARQVRYMDEHAACGLLGTAYVDEWGRIARNPEDDAAIRRQMLFRCPFCHPSVLIRSAALDDVGPYDEDMPYAEDWDLWLRIGRRWTLANLPDVCLEKGRHGDTLSERYFSRQLVMASEFCRRFAGDYPGHLRARAYHRASRLFFGLFPAGGGAHRVMGRVFSRTFGLDRPPDP